MYGVPVQKSGPRRRDLMTDWMHYLDLERGQMAAAAAVTDSRMM